LTFRAAPALLARAGPHSAGGAFINGAAHVVRHPRGTCARMTDTASFKMQITLTATQSAMIEAFQRKEGMASRAAAVQLLLDIALETVTSSGRRFWDKPIVTPEE